MVALNQLRNRLRAVENIKKITTSMEMVASARLRKAQIKAKKAKFYILKTKEILARLHKSSPDYQHPLMLQRKMVKKIGVVIVSSDRGLCGAYNERIFTKAHQLLTQYPTDAVELLLFGRKALSYYRSKTFTIRNATEGWGGKITLPEIKRFSDQLIASFLSGEFDQIWLIYTQFHNLMDRNTVCEPFLPIVSTEKEQKALTLNYIIEPDLNEVYQHLLSRYCMNLIEGMLNQSYASELAARIFAMKAAGHNAGEMEEALKLEHNKLRQGAITREILETTSTQRE